jgi:hypothetical protein
MSADRAIFPRAAHAAVPTILRHFSAAILIIAFLLLRFVLIDHLPDKWLQDSGRITDLVQTSSFETSSFGASAYLLSFVPDALWPFINAALASILVALTVYSTRTALGLAAAFMTLLPMMVLTLLAPSKETVVIAVALALYAIAHRYRPSTLILTVSATYAAYGSMVRGYYLLILAVFAATLVARKLPTSVMFLGVALGAVALFFLSPEIFHTLQDQRDTSNIYAQYIAQSDNRTAFFNPFVPDSAFAFLANYAYAGALLNFPFFRFVSPKEVLLFSNILVYAWLMFAGLRASNPNVRILSTLFLSHILVLWLFEPDLGSYFRHSSSVFVYLLPAFHYRETRATK